MIMIIIFPCSCKCEIKFNMNQVYLLVSFFCIKNNPISHETISHQQLNPTLILRQKLKMNRSEINFLIPARPSYRHIKWFDCLFLMAGPLPCLALRNKIYMSYKDQFKVCRARKINNYVTM